jgi:hypothetical protein
MVLGQHVDNLGCSARHDVLLAMVENNGAASFVPV